MFGAVCTSYGGFSRPRAGVGRACTYHVGRAGAENPAVKACNGPDGGCGLENVQMDRCGAVFCSLYHPPTSTKTLARAQPTGIARSGDTISICSQYFTHKQGDGTTRVAGHSGPQDGSWRPFRSQCDQGAPPGQARPARAASEPPTAPNLDNLTPRGQIGHESVLMRPMRRPQDRPEGCGRHPWRCTHTTHAAARAGALPTARHARATDANSRLGPHGRSWPPLQREQTAPAATRRWRHLRQ